MRVIILDNYELVSRWAANYVVEKINQKNPTEDNPFVLGCPTGSSPLGMRRIGLLRPICCTMLQRL